MYEQLIEEGQKEAARLSELRDASMEKLRRLKDPSGNYFAVTTVIPETERSLADLDTLVSTALSFSDGLDADKNWSFAPRAWIRNYVDAIKNTANSFDNFKNNIESIDGQYGGIKTIDAPNLAVVTGSGTPVDLKKLLANIVINVDKIFEAYFQLRSAISAPRSNEFTNLFRIFSSRRDELDSLSKKLQDLEKQSTKLASSTSAASDAATAARQESERLKDETDKDRKTTSEYANEASQKLEAVRSVSTTAQELSAAVSSYQANFKQFQEELDTRNKAYESQKDSVDRLISVLTSQEREIGRLTGLANGMLKGATNAGLATSFSDKQRMITRELGFARFGYYVSIGLLVFLTLPVFFYSLPKEVVAAIWGKLLPFDIPSIVLKDVPKTDYEHLTQFLARALLLLPGYLLVRFTSHRAERLFRLREHYAYKKSIAMSVEGFKEQAKEYSDEIAAASYFELAQNPANKMDIVGRDSRMINPVWEWLVKRIEGRTGRLLEDAVLGKAKEKAG